MHPIVQGAPVARGGWRGAHRVQSHTLAQQSETQAGAGASHDEILWHAGDIDSGIRGGAGGAQAGAAVLGSRLVSAMQPVEGDGIPEPGVRGTALGCSSRSTWTAMGGARSAWERSSMSTAIPR